MENSFGKPVEVEVRDSLEKAMKILKQKMSKEGILQELKRRRFYEKPSVKQHLAAIKMLFDWLVIGQVVAHNPAHAVRGPKHVVKRGKTPVLTAGQARELLDIPSGTPFQGAPALRLPSIRWRISPQ